MLCYTNVVDQEIQKNEDHVHDSLKECLRAVISFNCVQGAVELNGVQTLRSEGCWNYKL